ncbi:hypothetical protein B0H66DRAFT_233314 [Apodospora peruviana]|uniref:Cut9 interacting protein Scn1 n=1 Tax=Apodospora peruviana TaxID=516989 RepID=A0AAE0I4V0_9PEZI|nr:hypothetical protein B0H66DRAFT_233314 [Apodospora peruviana]
MCPPTRDEPAEEMGSSEKSVQTESQAPFPWHVGVCDAHCHPTDTMPSIASIGNMKARVLTIMATRSQDQTLVASVAADHAIQSRDILSDSAGPRGTKVVPAYGWHPWFSHQLYNDSAEAPTYALDNTSESQKPRHYEAVLTPAPDAAFVASLPEPQPLSEFLAATRQRLLALPTAMVGEIGVDRAFRLPSGDVEQSSRDENITPGGREGRMLSPYHVKMEHQLLVLKAQLRLAGEIGRPVSVHGVQAHGVLFDALASLWKGYEKEVISRRKKRLVAQGAEDFSSDDEDENEEPYTAKPFPPRICLHSFSGPPQMLRQYLNPEIPATLFFSFSIGVNLGGPKSEAKFAEVIQACPDDKLLIESDLHTAGDQMDEQLEQIGRKVCEIKGWTLDEGLVRLRRNYEDFVYA